MSAARKVEDVINACKSKLSLDFVGEAELVSLDWGNEGLPLLRSDKRLGALAQELLDTIRSKVLNKIATTAMNGAGYGAKPDIAHCKFLLSLIDSGAILGGYKEAARSDDPESILAHKRRLGLIQSEEE